ncbi:MAG TPA: VanZ family protein [Patescibacteria group bacterium]|nr:VanZ family protein [Patescibacteria group bacterium]
MRAKVVKQISAWLPVILWGALIFHFSSGTVPVASNIYWKDFAVKKTGHMLLFGAMSILIYRGLRMSGIDRKRSAIWAVFLATFYGATDEYHQMFTQGREARVRDVFIDSIGATLVILSTYYLLPKFSKKVQVIISKFNLN